MSNTNFWIIPIIYILYLLSLQVSNAIYIIHDKPVVAIGYIGSWWFCLLVLLFWISLEFLFPLYRKWMEDM